MREDGRLPLGRQRREQLQLHRGIGDVILAANNMGDREIDVVDDRGQRIKETAVLADQHRVGQRSAVDMRLAADKIAPGHQLVFEHKAPVRAPALGLPARARLWRSMQRGAVVNGRRPARLLHLAAALQLLGRLIARVEPAHRAQAIRRRLVKRAAVGLAKREIRDDPEPGEINLDFPRESLGGAGEISVIETKHESSIVLRREETIE